MLVNRGVILMERGKIIEARQSFQKAIKYKRDLASAYGNLGFLQFKEKQFKNAMRNLKRAIRLDPINMVYLKWLGYLHMRTGKYDKAEDAFKTVIKNRPHDLSLYLYLAELNKKSGNQTKALNHITRFVQLSGGKLEGYIKKLNDGEEQYTELLPDRSTILNLLAHVLKNRASEFKILYENVKKSEPE